MIDKDYFKDSFDYKNSELFKHSVALWQAGFLNTDKDTARLSFVKDILAKDFFIAPYKDNSHLVTFNNHASDKNKTKERPVIDLRGIFNNWDTLYILCLGRKFIVRRRYLDGTCSFDIYDRYVGSNDTGYRKPTFSIIKTSNSSILQNVKDHIVIVLSWNETSQSYGYALSIYNTQIEVGPVTPNNFKWVEFYACRALVLYIIYRAYVITMDRFLDKLAELKTHSAVEQENFYKEIIGFKITKLYRNPLTAHRGDEVPLIWNYISCAFNFPETIAEIEDKIHDCSMFNEYLTGKMLSEKSNKFAVGAIIVAVVICIVQLIAPFVQNLIMK